MYSSPAEVQWSHQTWGVHFGVVGIGNHKIGFFCSSQNPKWNSSYKSSPGFAGKSGRAFCLGILEHSQHCSFWEMVLPWFVLSGGSSCVFLLFPPDFCSLFPKGGDKTVRCGSDNEGEQGECREGTDDPKNLESSKKGRKFFGPWESTATLLHLHVLF